MRKLLQRLLKNPIIRLSDKYASRPDRARVHAALNKLYSAAKKGGTGNVCTINFNAAAQKFVILSDQHKGARNYADDFALSQKNYLAALNHYSAHNFHYINLGDSEELWENSYAQVKKHNLATFAAERQFVSRNAFTKLFGNHDLYWDNDPLAQLNIQELYGQKLKVYEAVLLQTEIAGQLLNIFMTHGHQGDRQSDGNWFSKWFVSNIWGPLQAYLRINPNTPANNNALKTLHNNIMYQWSQKQHNTLLITGHTHQPVFRSLTHLEKLYQELDQAKVADDDGLISNLERQIGKRHLKGDTVLNFDDYHPTYFNSGCCCYDDGDITGLELDSGFIRLIKWQYKQRNPVRIVLEECHLSELLSTQPIEKIPCLG
jgi:UDP-2,3-diacylglucosamine pyrophosphatase LpxH